MLAVLLASLVMTGAATAATIKGSGHDETIRGGSGNDVLYGYGGRDRLDGLGGNDLLNGGSGRDLLVGGTGADRVTSADGEPDSVDCGPGRDVVNADLDDVLTGCEVVSRRLSSDPFRGGGQHGTEVEPDSFAYGRTIVTVFQIGRYVTGGAAAIGYASSRDAGRSWTSGVLPGLTIFSAPQGTLDLVSDPVVTYDRVHRTWLVATLGAAGDATLLLVSRSRDGVDWSAPATAAHRFEGDFDKPWITCDNWRGSRFAGRCYLSYVDFERQGVMTRHSLDGGKTWSAQTGWLVPPALQDAANGVQPIVRPNGALVVPFSVFSSGGAAMNEIAVIRSLDGGSTFTPAAHVAQLSEIDVFELRVPPLPSATIGGDGTVYVSWSDCRFVRDCNANGLVVTRSRDGVNWSAPADVPTGGRGDGVNHFLPGLAARGSGPRTKLALAYYSAPTPTGCNYSCNASIDAWLSRSGDGGRTWGPPQRLTSEPVRSNWLADTGLGRMLGDYISTSWVGTKPIAVLPLASPPLRGSYREQIFATTRVR